MNKKWFVYCLRDSRDKKIFYVGKGKGQRPLFHLRESKRWRKGLSVSNEAKCKKIVEIEDGGGMVAISILKRFDDETDAYCFESMLIHAIKIKLTNRHHGSNKYRRLMEVLRTAIPQAIKEVRYWREYAKCYYPLKIREASVVWMDANMRALRQYLKLKQKCYGKM